MSAVAITDPAQELAALLDRLAAAGVRVTVSPDRRRLVTEAPRGALSPDLREALRTYRGELLAMLTATPAPARDGLHVCKWGAAHHRHWRYHPGELRHVCAACYPDAWAGLPREELADGADGIAADRRQAQERERIEEGETRARRVAWIVRARRELAAWALAHEPRPWPRLAIAYSAGNHAGYRAPFAYVCEGASAWAVFLAGASGPDLAAAYRAAGLDRRPSPTPKAPHAAQPGEESGQEGEGEELADGAGAVLALDDTGAYLCRGLAAPERLAYDPADVATIAGLVRYAEARGCANLWFDPQSHVRARMGANPAAFLADAAAVGVRADASRGISQIYTAHVASEARPRRHTVVLTLPDPAGNNSEWKHGADVQALALAYAGEALAWPFRGLPHYVGRRLILKHNAARGWYERPAAPYASLSEVREAIRRRRDLAPDLVWRRLPTAGEESGAAYLHGYDKASCYLSMCSSIDLPIGAPSWHAGARLEKRPGQGVPSALWHVTISHGASAYNGRELPTICGEGDTWVWTPALRAALDMGYEVTAWHGAVIWPEQHRILNTWKQRLWGALLALRDPLRYPDALARELAGDLVKAVYRQTIGMFGHDRPRPDRQGTQGAASGAPSIREELADAGEGDTGEGREELQRWQRPEWQALIISEAAARMVRHIEKCRAAGLVPLLAHTDSLALLGASPDAAGLLAPAGLTLDPDTCGAFIPEYSWALDPEIRAALRNPKHQQSIRGHALPSVWE